MLPAPRNLPITSQYTASCTSGRSRLQTKPSAESLYLTLSSLRIRLPSSSRYCQISRRVSPKPEKKLRGAFTRASGETGASGSALARAGSCVPAAVMVLILVVGLPWGGPAGWPSRACDQQHMLPPIRRRPVPARLDAAGFTAARSAQRLAGSLPTTVGSSTTGTGSARVVDVAPPAALFLAAALDELLEPLQVGPHLAVVGADQRAGLLNQALGLPVDLDGDPALGVAEPVEGHHAGVAGAVGALPGHPLVRVLLGDLGVE